MRWQGTCYCAHDPEWAWTPLSGDGARLKGGRFNPPGVPALYLALTLEGMFVEMGHGFGHRIEPLNVCSYAADIDGLADLRDGAGRSAAGVSLADTPCAWAYERANGRVPASWASAERLRAQGAAGILVPSFAAGARADMHNLVLWIWGHALPHKIEVHDPSGRLPKSQLSWR